MATINVKDSSGTVTPIEKPNANGRGAAAASRPVALSTEDLAVLSTISTSVDGLETLVGATNTALATLDTRVDGLEGQTGIVTETAPASDTASSGLNGRLQRIAQNLTTFFGAKVTAVAALGAGGSGAIGWLSQIWDKLNGTLAVGQVTSAYDVALSFSRPADTTAYTANDVVGGVLTFANSGPNAAAIMVTGVQFENDIAAIPSGMTTFRLHLYSATPPSALADNAAFDLPSGDRSSYLGYIDLGSLVDLGATLYTELNNINKQVKLSGTSLFGYLVTIGAYTPSSADPFKVTVHTQAV